MIIILTQVKAVMVNLKWLPIIINSVNIFVANFILVSLFFFVD